MTDACDSCGHKESRCICTVETLVANQNIHAAKALTLLDALPGDDEGGTILRRLESDLHHHFPNPTKG